MTDFIRLDRQQFTDAPQEPWFDELLARINDNTARIDRRSLEEGRRVTTRLVARVLGEMADAAHMP